MMDAYQAALFAPTDKPVKPELLVSALLHLMSNYSVSLKEDGSCARLAAVIERHLQAMADAADLAPVLRATCEDLAEQWGNVVERDVPRPEKETLMARLIAAARLN